MEKNHFCLVLIAFLLVFSSLAFSDFDTGIYCFDDIDCADYPNSYCNLQTETSTCFTRPSSLSNLTLPAANASRPASNLTSPSITTPTITSTVALEQSVASLRTSLTTVQADVTSLKSDVSVSREVVSNLNNNVNSLQQQFSLLQQQLAEIKQNTASNSQQLDNIVTGLASLQDEINATKSNLTSVEETMVQRKSRVQNLTIFLFLIVAVALGFIYYLTRSKPFKPKEKAKEPSPQILDFVSAHIKQGKTYPQIKEKLLQSGWSEADIRWAYQETTRKNYQQYLRKKSLKPAAAFKPAAFLPSAKAPNTKKMALIAGVSLLLLVGIFFLLQAVVGQAVFLKKTIQKTGLVEYGIECTGNHTLAPDGATCCFDFNQNSICDSIEEFEAAQKAVTQEVSVCHNSKECPYGKSCINRQCALLADFYQAVGCDKPCNFYSAKVKVIYSPQTQKARKVACTSDLDCDDNIPETTDSCQSPRSADSLCLHSPVVEVYYLHPQRGSYAAAGALAWTLLEPPDYCAPAPLPIEIKRISGSKVLSKEIITFKKSEERLLSVDSSSFTLKLEEIYELCDENPAKRGLRGYALTHKVEG